MGHKEYSVTNIIDILRRAKAKDSFRRIARSTGIDRNTIRNYLRLAAAHGFDDTTSDDRIMDYPFIQQSNTHLQCPYQNYS
jgi:transposase